MIAIMSADISSLFEAGRQIELGASEILFRAGDSVSSMFLVVRGKLRLMRNLKSGSQMILHEISHGNVVAEASAYSRVYHCDGVAHGNVICRSIPVDVFHSGLSKSAALSLQWAAHLAHATQAARTLAEIRNLKTVNERLDTWLDLGNELPPKGEWQSVADTLGVSREALYRALAQRRQL